MYLVSLVQLCCREGWTLRTNITGMCGECSQCLGHTGFAPAHGMCAFLVRLQVALLGNCLRRALDCVHFPDVCHSGSASRILHQGTDLVGPAFCALPRSEQHRWPGAWRAHSQFGSASYLLPSPRHSVSWVHHESTVSGVPCVSFGGLISDCHHPGGYQPFRIPGRLVSNWEPAHSLVDDAISGAKIVSHLLALAGAHLPLCLHWGKGLVHILLALLWCSLNPLFCEQARLLRESSLSLSLFFFSPLDIPQFGLLSHLSSLRLSSGHSGPVPTLSMQPTPPCSALNHCWQTPASGLPLHWEFWLGM